MPASRNNSQRIRQIAILGPGLLGGSIGLAVRKRKLANQVIVWGRRIESAQAAVKREAADKIAMTPKEAVRNADIIILCTPVGVMSELAKDFRSELRRDSIVTDVASTKYDIVKQLSTILSGKTTYIGSHPMAGGEKEGLMAAHANLFKGSVCILTPQLKTKKAPLQKLAAFWEKLGCRIRMVSPIKHDELVAHISHLPHLVAAGMMNLIHHRKSESFDFIGNGFRDVTRIAAGSPEMWSEIVRNNREEIRRALDLMIEELENIRRHLINVSDAELKVYLRQAKQKRDELDHQF